MTDPTLIEVAGAIVGRASEKVASLVRQRFNTEPALNSVLKAALANPGVHTQRLAVALELVTAVDPDFDRKLHRTWRHSDYTVAGNVTRNSVSGTVHGNVNQFASVAGFPVSIWLGNGTDHAAVESALVELLEESGVDVIERTPARCGSWYRTLGVRLRQVMGNSSDDVCKRIGRKIDLEVYEQPQAEVDEKQGKAAAALIDSLKGENEACIQTGSILLLKMDGRIIVRNLTQIEMAHIGRNAAEMLTPQRALKALQQASDSSEGMLPPDAEPKND